jgi:FkbM family methyltransferase
MLATGKKVIRRALARFGYRLVPLESSPLDLSGQYLTECVFSSLKDLGFAPKHIVDVGANKGDWTRTALKYFPDAAYTLVEPQNELRVHIRDLEDRGCRIRWVHAGAADQPGVLPFTIRERDDSSTFGISEVEATASGFRRTTVEIRTLNEIVASGNFPAPEMVKIDAEGFDLKVLTGASDLVGKTEVIFIEVSVRGAWENNLLNVVKRMEEHSYVLLDVTELNRSPKYGVLWLAELAFVRKASLLLDAVRSYA